MVKDSVPCWADLAGMVGDGAWAVVGVEEGLGGVAIAAAGGGRWVMLVVVEVSSSTSSSVASDAH